MSESHPALRARRISAGSVPILLLAIAAGVVAAYGNVVFAGRSLLGTNTHDFLGARDAKALFGPEALPLETWTDANLKPSPNLHDPGAGAWQWEPAARLLRDSIRSGAGLPWWDPATGAGVPGLANPTGTPFFPPYLAMVLLSDSPTARTLYSVLLQIGAGFALALLLRRHGLSATACVVGGLAFALSGGMAQSVSSMIGQTLACAPWALLATCYFLDRPGPRRAALLSLAYAAIALSSFPPMVVAVFFYAGVYAAARLLADRQRGAWRPALTGALAWALASALAVALAAFYLLPVAALYRATPDVAKRYEQAHELAIEPGNLLQLGSPLLLGGVKILDRTWIEPTRHATEVPYVGAFVLGLAAFAARRGGQQARSLLWLAVGTTILIVAKGLGLPPVSWLTQRPPLSFVHFVPYFLHSLGLPAALLAALGWDAIARGSATRIRIAVALLAGIAWLAATWVVGDQRGALDGPHAASWLSELAVVAALLMLPVALAAALRGSRRAGRRSAFLLALGLAALAGEGIRNTWYPRQVRWDIWSHPHPMVATLQREIGDGRLFAYHTFPANWGSAYGVPQLESLMAFNAPRSHDLYVAATHDRTSLFMTSAERLPSEPFLTRAAIRLVATSDRTPWTLPQIEPRPYRKVFDDGHTFVFRRRSAPRFFFTSRYNVVDAERAREAALSDLQVRRLWLEEPPGFGSRANRGPNPPVEVLEFRNNGYRLRVRAPRPGLVYCSESHMPGWTATVNDRPAKILAANYAFRAVEVGPGENVVELTYRPPGLRAGLWSSGSALALALALLWLPWRRSASAQPPR